MAGHATQWDLEDFAAWEAVMTPRTAVNAVFMDAVRREYAICVPPDCDLGADGFDERCLRAHILVPHGAFRDTWLLEGLTAVVAEARTPRSSRIPAVFRRSESPQPRSDALSPTGKKAVPNEATLMDSRCPQLQLSGPAFAKPAPGVGSNVPPSASSDAEANTVIVKVLAEEEIKTGEGCARIFVIERSVLALAGKERATATPIPTVYGDSPDDNVMAATDALFSLDVTGELMRSLNSELQSFRDHYEPIQGYESDLFDRVSSIARNQSHRWVMRLGSNFVSRRRSERATALAVHSYVHGRTYQFVFPAMCALEATSSAEFEVGAERIQASAKSLVDFDVPQSIAQRLNLAPLDRMFHRFNGSTSPFDKVQVACAIMSSITDIVNRASAASGEGCGADILVPILALSLASHPPRDMGAQVAYMERFLPEEATRGNDEARSYAVVSFRAALEYIRRYSDEEDVARRLSDISFAPSRV